jgi:Leucine-rich repeat (LRR) protein
MKNQINCNCLFKSTAKFLQENKHKVSIAQPLCSSPNGLKDFSVLDLPLSVLKCDSNDEKQVRCKIKSKCPRGCKCDAADDYVDCANRGLKIIDIENIPEKTRTLDLQENQITSVPSLMKLQYLEFLDLSNNRLVSNFCIIFILYLLPN